MIPMRLKHMAILCSGACALFASVVTQAREIEGGVIESVLATETDEDPVRVVRIVRAPAEFIPVATEARSDLEPRIVYLCRVSGPSESQECAWRISIVGAPPVPWVDPGTEFDLDSVCSQ